MYADALVRYLVKMAFKFPSAKPVQTVWQIQTVEDILECVVQSRSKENSDLTTYLDDNEWIRNFVVDVHKWSVIRGKPLTTDQATVVLRIFKRLRPTLVRLGYITEAAADLMLERPRYNQTPRPSLKIASEVRYVGGNRLAFRFKRKSEIIDFLNYNIKGKSIFSLTLAEFDWTNNIWVVEVNRETIEPLVQMIRQFNFHWDKEVEDYLVEAYNAQRAPCQFRLVDGQIIAEINDNELLAAWVIGPLNGTVI